MPRLVDSAEDAMAEQQWQCDLRLHLAPEALADPAVARWLAN